MNDTSMNEKLKLAELTSEEARNSLNEDAVILLPMGSTEDQGTHAPMGDYMAADCVALDIARAARIKGIPAFVAPCIPYGGRDFFISSHGGISIRQSTLVAVIDDMIDSLVRHGLKKILIINGHGGNTEPIAEVCMKWRLEEDIFIPAMYLWKIAYGLLQTALGAERAARSSGHGADPLTSVGLHYFPEFLRPDLICKPQTGLTVNSVPVTTFGQITYDGIDIQAPVTAAETAPDGVWSGDPTLCSADTGAMLAKKLSDIGASFISDHVATGFSSKAV